MTKKSPNSTNTSASNSSLNVSREHIQRNAADNEQQKQHVLAQIERLNLSGTPVDSAEYQQWLNRLTHLNKQSVLMEEQEELLTTPARVAQLEMQVQELKKELASKASLDQSGELQLGKGDWPLSPVQSSEDGSFGDKHAATSADQRRTTTTTVSTAATPTATTTTTTTTAVENSAINGNAVEASSVSSADLPDNEVTRQIMEAAENGNYPAVVSALDTDDDVPSAKQIILAACDANQVGLVAAALITNFDNRLESAGSKPIKTHDLHEAIQRGKQLVDRNQENPTLQQALALLHTAKDRFAKACYENAPADYQVRFVESHYNQTSNSAFNAAVEQGSPHYKSMYKELKAAFKEYRGTEAQQESWKPILQQVVVNSQNPNNVIANPDMLPTPANTKTLDALQHSKSKSFAKPRSISYPKAAPIKDYLAKENGFETLKATVITFINAYIKERSGAKSFFKSKGNKSDAKKLALSLKEANNPEELLRKVQETKNSEQNLKGSFCCRLTWAESVIKAAIVLNDWRVATPEAGHEVHAESDSAYSAESFVASSV